MPILIDATLAEPPGSVTCLRDLTLYANCFVNRNVVIECSPELKDLYWNWLKTKGAFDYIQDILDPFAINGFSIRRKNGNVNVPYINEFNLDYLRSTLPPKS